MNIIDAFNIFYREDVITDFLKNCFEDSPEFIRRFLGVADVNIPPGAEFKIFNRLGLGKTIGTPDMVIIERINEVPKIIVIENKLGTGEGIEQTLRYESDMAKESILKKLGVISADFHFIFLTLDTTVIPGSSNFRQIHYRVFTDSGWMLHDSQLKLIFNDFKEKIQDFYDPLTDPKQALSSACRLDSMQKKICWQKILSEQFKNHSQFNIEWGEVGGAGRNNFLFLISKKNWLSEKPFQEAGLANTFNIHIDTYINLLSPDKQMIENIGIRYETNPYKPHNKINEEPEYTQFIQNKLHFTALFYNNLKTVFTDSKKRNSKLLLATVPVDQSDFDNNVQDYTNRVTIIERVIDQTLEEIHNK